MKTAIGRQPTHKTLNWYSYWDTDIDSDVYIKFHTGESDMDTFHGKDKLFRTDIIK